MAEKGSAEVRGLAVYQVVHMHPPMCEATHYLGQGVRDEGESVGESALVGTLVGPFRDRSRQTVRAVNRTEVHRNDRVRACQLGSGCLVMNFKVPHRGDGSPRRTGSSSESGGSEA